MIPAMPMPKNITGDLGQVIVQATVQPKLFDVKTGKCVKVFPAQKNMVLDSGLNRLAGATSTPGACSICRCGSSNTSNSTASGAITFTQSTTTITASGGFFTAGMVGCIFKWGTGSGGAEYYITAFTDSTHVTVDTSATVGTPDVATVWFVQRTTLVTTLASTGSYQTGTGDCETTFTGGGATVNHKRTFAFAPQGSSMNVNEIGWGDTLSGSNINGRLVLGSTVVVPTTNFLVVVLTVSYTYSPSAPTAVSNVGTNIDTSGNAMIEWMATGTVNSTTGNTDAPPASGQGALDGANGNQNLRWISTTYTQNSAIANTQSGAPNPTLFTSFTTNQTWTNDGARGRMRLVYNQTGISTTGQQFFGVTTVCSGTSGSRPTFNVKFTTPFTAPNGSFLPVVTFKVTYNRVLTN